MPVDMYDLPAFSAVLDEIAPRRRSTSW